ncbi:hypothetical protein E2C01_079920 [Portunus trituberculatus]|uniref:Uncharacterized protein n=1 Tax=Portunus trituberculatus TaxID=210409 RepID=A0A5B7IWW2_PORTR|nr:hypothetical protein [Portunus trituberculatus]
MTTPMTPTSFQPTAGPPWTERTPAGCRRRQTHPQPCLPLHADPPPPGAAAHHDLFKAHMLPKSRLSPLFDIT